MYNTQRFTKKDKKLQKNIDPNIKKGYSDCVVKQTKNKNQTQNMKPAIIISSTGTISAILGGKSVVCDNRHPNYGKIIDAIRAEEWNSLIDLFDVAKSVSEYVSESGDVKITNGVLFFKGEEIHNSLSKRVIDLMREKLPFKPIVSFLENLMKNTSKRAVDELYSFLEIGNLPITSDGHFLAFKNIRADWKDIYTGTFDNSVGSVCQMERNKVDEDKDRTCSYGLHFCSQEYLPHYRNEDGRTVIVKINPADVVAIPADYNNTKGRCCRYEVVAELKGEPSNYTKRNLVSDFDKSEYDDNDNDGDNCATMLYQDGYEDAICGNDCISDDEHYCNGYEDGLSSVSYVEKKQNKYRKYQRDSNGRFCKKS